MNHATSIAFRSAGLCLRSLPWPQPTYFLHRAFHCSSTFRCIWSVKPTLTPLGVFKSIPKHDKISQRAFTTSKFFRLEKSRALYRLRAHNAQSAQVEAGVAFREADLTEEELHDQVFGAVSPPPRVANRLLRVLQARRIDGTLDLGYDKELSKMMKNYPYAMESALEWLRDNYPLDEDAAIIARLEREENGGEESPSELTERAQNMGIYEKQQQSQDTRYYGPQSGRYHAKLSQQEDDVFGQSELERIRAKNEAEAAEEEKRLDNQIEQIRLREEAKAKEKSEAIAVRPEQSIESSDGQIFREPNEFEKWILRARNRASSDLTVESPEMQKLTIKDRLLSSLIFVIIGCAACYLFAQYWIPPRQSERLWPNTSLSFATVGGIVALNVTVYCLWRFPPALRLLHRYFCVSPLYPRAASMLGNVFSHHNSRHLFMNMFALLVFGPSLHEDVGRGTFLGIYLASGLVGSFASLSRYVLRGIFTTTSMGASGCIWGITTAYFVVHSDHKFVLFFIPNEWKDALAMKGWVFLGMLMALDAVVGIRQKNIDVWAHWFGMVTGIASSAMWKWNRLQESVDKKDVIQQPKALMVLEEKQEKAKRNS